MKRITVILLKYILAFSIAIVLLWWSFHSLSAKDVEDIKEALLRAKIAMIIPVVIILLLSHLFRAYRWQQLIEPLGYKTDSFQLLCGVLIGYIANQFIPRAGEIIRCTSISKYNKIPAEKLIGTIVAERAFDMITLLLIGVVTVFLEYDFISSYLYEIINAIQTNLASNGPKRIILLVVFAVFVILLLWIIKKFKEHKFIAVISRIIKGIWHGLTSIKNVKNKPLFIIYTILIWTGYVFATWMGCLALEETAHLALDTGLVMLVFGTFGIIVAPGGLGAYPIAIQKTLVLYQLPETIGLASGWLLWLAQFAVTVIFGSLAYIALKFKYGRNEKHKLHS